MGQVCSGTKSEERKGGALEEPPADDVVVAEPTISDPSGPQSTTPSQTGTEEQTTAEDAERLKVMRVEQARLDMIVSTAGRGMVAVRSTRGSTGYYDQGFAAALAQHLEQTTQFPDQLEVRLPVPSSSTSVYERLSQPQWDGIALGTGGGLAGCAGENPVGYLDNIAESLLDSVVPAKQQLFAGVSPMVENLL